MRTKWASPLIRLVAGVLTASTLFSLTGCRKTKSKSSEEDMYYSGKEIRESDPYFQSESFPIEIPTEPGREVKRTYIFDCKYLNGLIVANYDIEYAMPEVMDPEDTRAYYVSGIALFDDHGHYIRELPVSSSIILGMDADKDGNVIVLSYTGSPEGGNSSITKLDKNGEILDQIDVPEIPYSNSRGNEVEFSVLEDGRYFINGTEMGIFGPDGKKILTVSDMGRYLEGPLIFQDGKTYIRSFRLEGSYKETQFKEIDLNTGRLGQGIDAAFLDEYKNLLSTSEGLYASSSNGLCTLDVKTGKASPFFNWNDTDISRSDLIEADTYVKSENELLVISKSYDDGSYDIKLTHLTRAEKNPHAGKKMIILKGENLQFSFDLHAFVKKYNLDPSAKARVILVDGSMLQIPGEDQAKSQQHQYLELFSGTGADILFGYASQSLYQSPNLMLDLNPFIDGPNGLSRDDYFDNILRSMEKGGKLYHMPSRIILNGFQINTDYIHKEKGWTFSEFEDCKKEIPDNVSFLEGIDRSLFLTYLLSIHNDFINYESKTVDFQNDTMKTILRLSKEYGVKERPEDEGDVIEYEGGGVLILAEDQTTKKFNEGLLAARLKNIGSLSEISMDKNVLKEKSSYLGYPSPDGTGMVATPEDSLGISASSQYADLAWDFIRFCLTSDYTSTSGSYGIPVSRAVFENECQLILEYQNKVYEQAVSEHARSQDLITYYCRPTKEDIDELRKLMEDVTTSTNYDPNILSIVFEEAGGYFAGDKTEDEALKMIQDRVSTVIREL